MKNAVLYISRSSWVVGYWKSAKAWVTEEWRYSADKEIEYLNNIKKISLHWELLLAEDVSYYKEVSYSGSLDRASIAAKLPVLIPESLEPRQWDWKVFDPKLYLLEAVSGPVWKLILQANKIGIIWVSIQTKKYWSKQHPKFGNEIVKILESISREREEGGKDDKALAIEITPRKSNWIWVTSILVFLVAVGGVGAYWYYPRYFQPKNVVVVSPEPSPTWLPSVVPQPADYNVRVENGGANPGEATRIGKELTELGFANVQVENSNEKVTGVIVTSKGNLVNNVRDEIQKVLDGYPVEYRDNMSVDEPIDILIVMGKY